MRRVGEPRRCAVRRIALTKEGLHDVHDPAEEMCPTAQRRRPDRFQEGPLGDLYLQQVMKAIVDNAVGVIHGQEIIACEHLEHGLGEVEIYRGVATLGTGAGPVEDQFGVVFLHGTFYGPGADAVAIVIDEVGECGFFFSDLGFYEVSDSSSVSVK